mmetsp:Transcript_139548/g.362835  ORF Transcript_139548/g.362835 Transcript_139548/m.362835 type:complete len:1234 (+) Transcript_139548:117-3818(+)
MAANPISILNLYCQKYKVRPTWKQDTHGADAGHCKSWTMRLQVPLPDGTIEHSEGSATTKKEAQGNAASVVVLKLSASGFLDGVKSADISGGLSNSAGPPEAKRQKTVSGFVTPGLLSGSISPGSTVGPQVMAPRSTPPGQATVNANIQHSRHPVSILNEQCMKNKARMEWVWEGGDAAASAPGRQWMVRLTVRGLDGTILGEAVGTSVVKKEAQVMAAQSYLSGNGVTPGEAGATTLIEQPGLSVSDPNQTKQDSDVHAFTNSLLGVPSPGLEPTANFEKDFAETFGYNFATARTRLNEYLAARGLPIDIPVQGPSMGPFTAAIEIPLPRGRGSVWSEHQANTKKDATKHVALRVCVELCRLGEIPPFQSKKEAMAEGIAACSACVKPGVQEQLDTILAALGIPVDVDAVTNQAFGQSILQDFDAAPWSTQPKVRQMSWSPPVWGQSPWQSSADSISDPVIDEVAAEVNLQTQLAARDTSPGYAHVRAKREELPIAPLADHILETIDRHPVVLIAGSTGCGKTTQIPQFLLERASRQGCAATTNIVCTQPRRIAAITVAERVAKERGEALGESVGFNVRFHKVLPRGYASICYMTTGMLLRWLVSNGLRGISHLIVDEVHERDLDTDFLLTVVRQLLQGSAGLRVVLMSATMDLNKWSAYFGQGLGMVEIPGRLYPVKVHYLEDIQKMLGSPSGTTLDSIVTEEVPVDLIERLLSHIVHQECSEALSGAILVFLPGWESISALQARLTRNSALYSKVRLHVLHSKVPKEEQQAAFHPAPAPLVKVVLSTNIAESSVTITDVVYVIDACRVKQLVPHKGSAGRTAYRLTNMLAAQQSLQQRAGRAGRVQEGVCYRLITKGAYEQMPLSLQPDMTRLPLHQVTLTLKSLNFGRAASFLSQAPDPPHPGAVRQAVQVLQDLKALDGHERITDLGLKLAMLPIEPRMGFALLASCMLGLGEPMAVISAIVSSAPLYQNEMLRGKDLDKQAYKAASMQLLSDHYDALITYYRLKELPDMQLERVCRQEFVNYQSFKHIAAVADQTLQILRGMGFEADATGSCREWIMQMGTEGESEGHQQLWSALTFLLGVGLEHFAVRMGIGRRVWLSPTKTSQMSLSPGVPEIPPSDPLRCFVLFGELRESEWTSSCRAVSAAGAVATTLGAARDLTYDVAKGNLLLDGWAPVAMSPQLAARMVATRLALRSCLLNVAKSPDALSEHGAITSFRALLYELLHPWA